MTLTMATAAYRFAALPAPGIGEPQGSQVARAVAIPGIGTLPDPLRRLILAAVNIAVSIIYRGKDFHHHHGVNVWALGIRWAQFDITHDGRQTFLVYDVPTNPRPMRRIVSEIRTQTAERQLCRLTLQRRSGRCRHILYFTLEPRIHPGRTL
ncbi:hypothetical protein [Mycolicibacterium fluoranthenivorans]|uniref:Uncharacterized protein n=1 Tax=Mycolicibacterium fluoranthenivorans TaxID=258505 RepID=A0A7X5U2D0_9MYCO|nr:hypothetical protein [Mycolicibacterium fluoranthenivorans]MCV7354329.1 hypothetical protein [Mycolicibacterium fluoranthenivorans]NIH97099.1 hypothetical protein [Mycolicibacterium fluoranthenivorans]